MTTDEKTRAELQEEVTQLREKLAVLEANDQGREVSGTDRHLAEELSVANEELAIFKQFAEASWQGFSMADLDGHLTYLNPALCRMLGLKSADEIIGKHLSTCYSNDANRKGTEQVRPRMDSEGHWEGEMPLLSVDGTEVPTWHNVFVIPDENGRPFRLAVVITDISERLQARAAIDRERRTLKHMLQASDHERQLIAYDIHDGLAQHLAGAIMQFQIYEYQKGNKPDEAQKAFAGAMTMLKQGHYEARRLISGVRPPILDESGVVPAVAHLVNEESSKQNIQMELESKVQFNRLASVLENVIYRIVQESLTNAVCHSKSEKLRIRLVQRGDVLHVDIRDWGIGFDPGSIEKNRFGLEGIRERARLLGGRCRIRSKPGKGTSVAVELPLVEVQAEA